MAQARRDARTRSYADSTGTTTRTCSHVPMVRFDPEFRGSLWHLNIVVGDDVMTAEFAGWLADDMIAAMIANRFHASSHSSCANREP
eukprot:scaffold98641_cov27-Prasinocladus_malaysianus.AAC.1